MAQALSNLPIGAKIKFGKHRVNTESPEPIIWVIADKNHSGYPTDSVNLITEKIIDLRAVDAMENVSDDGSDFDVDTYYPSSNIHRWLNESSTSWYAKAHSDDKPPKNEYITYGTGYYDKPGFLYNFTEEERLAILPMSFPLGSGYYLNAKIVIPLLSEIMGVSSVDNSGTQFAYFATRGFACNLTSQAYTNTLSTNKPTTVAQNWLYATRNAAYNDMYGISNTGARTNYSTYDGSVGLRPVTNLSSYTKMSDEVDSDGCYNILSQVAPIISGTNSDIGIKTAPFSQTYTVTDADNDIVTVREYVDNVEIRSYVATLGSDSNFVVSGETWLKLTNGVHTLKIVATDGFDSVTRTFTFTKNVSMLVVERKVPITASTQPKSIIVTVVKNIPTEAIFKVEACNNGFDASPTWEDITSDVNRGEIYDFTNTEKTAEQWGVNIRVTVDRNGAEGACYITEIGGNFE